MMKSMDSEPDCLCFYQNSTIFTLCDLSQILDLSCTSGVLAPVKLEYWDLHHGVSKSIKQGNTHQTLKTVLGTGYSCTKC